VPSRAFGLVMEWASLHQNELMEIGFYCERRKECKKNRAIKISHVSGRFFTWKTDNENH